MLTLFYLVWCALLWMLYAPPIARERIAVAVIGLGALPRLYLALATLPTAWMLDASGFAVLIAFHALTLLWFFFLGALALKREAVAHRLAVPMLILAAIECITPLSAVAGHVTLKPLVQLVFCLAQFWFLRTTAKQAEPAGPKWSNL